MRTVVILIAALLMLGSNFGQGKGEVPPSIANPQPVLGLSKEPHHILMLQNDTVRVYRLTLKSGEATAVHRHGNFYAYVSLRPVTLANEVRGRQAVISTLEAGELRTSKGGFNLAERNQSKNLAELVVIELVKSPRGEFSTPMGGFRYHDAAFGETFEAAGIRAYEMTIAAEGGTEQHAENYDRLIVAISRLKLKEDIEGQAPMEFEMESGDIRWIPRGLFHSTTNIGTSPAVFFTLEFN
jgi:uncharacterized RmlC-like cupin family protein